MEHKDGLSDSVSMDAKERDAKDAKQAGLFGLSTGDLISVIIGVALVILVLRTLDLGSFLKVALGLSFVIFIHELGHFLVAKMCDVHVTHFSIGFGPKVPGCWFKMGETTYQLSMIPLGGYVQMVGQVDGDEANDTASEGDPRSYRNKGVLQRMAIISAGVIMNAIFAVLCFVVIYRGPGKDRPAAVISRIDSGGPGFVAGLRTGSVIVDIDGIKNPNFDDLRMTVSSSNAGDKIEITCELPGQKPIDYAIEPRKTRDDPQPVISISNAPRLKLESRNHVVAQAKNPVSPTSPAGRAEPPFEFEDEIIGTTDPSALGTVTLLSADPRRPDQRDYFEFEKRLLQLDGKDFSVRVHRKAKGEAAGKDVDIRVPASFRWSIGARMTLGKIVAIRKDSPADLAKVQVPHSPKANFFVEGDLIEKVEVKNSDGTTRIFDMATHDPERLPVDLRAWSAKLDAAPGGTKAERTVKLHLRRHRDEPGTQFQSIVVDLAWDRDWAYEQTLPLSLASPLAIPELGLAYQVQTTVAEVTDPNGKLQVGDVIKNLKTTQLDLDGKEETTSWVKSKRDFNPEEWAHVGYNYLTNPSEFKKITLKVERGKETLEIEVVPTLDKTWPTQQFGWLLAPDMRIQRADTILDAVSLGLRDTRRTMIQILQNVRQMFTGRIDWKNLGGPITIARIAYSYAGYDIWEFVFFLAMISVNLAVINFLPIPVLDGGHMVFLLYEGIRGKPPSEGVRIGASYVGLAFLLSLMLLVFCLDIGRFFPS